MNYEDLKTSCCNTNYQRVSKLKYQCSNCKQDVSMEFVYQGILLEDYEKAR